MKIASIAFDHKEKARTIEVTIMVGYFDQNVNGTTLIGNHIVNVKIKKPTKAKLLKESKK